jgi:hypothetical protein
MKAKFIQHFQTIKHDQSKIRHPLQLCLNTLVAFRGVDIFVGKKEYMPYMPTGAVLPRSRLNAKTVDPTKNSE